jgi:hypothetical protein
MAASKEILHCNSKGIFWPICYSSFISFIEVFSIAIVIAMFGAVNTKSKRINNVHQCFCQLFITFVPEALGGYISVFPYD